MLFQIKPIASTMAFLSAILILMCVLLPPASTGSNQDFAEELFIGHLPDGRVLAVFEFATTWNIHPLLFSQPNGVHHYGFFPKSLAEVIGHYGVQELHLTLTMGKWRTRVWGYPPHPAPPGAEFWSWFLPNTDADVEWPGLVNAMSGLLCAHLNYIDSTSTYQPLHSFKPQGAIIGNISSSQLHYAALPRETVCTENFTPWIKLLPCGSSAGLGSLFSALKLYNTEFHSLGLHFTPFCKVPDCSEVGVKLLQTLTVVFSPLTGWSLESLFSKSIHSSCPLASSSRVLVDTTSRLHDAEVEVDPSPSSVDRLTMGGVVREWAVFDVVNLTASTKKFSLTVKTSMGRARGMPEAPVLNLQRFLTGSGHEWGGLHTEIINSHPTSELKALYLDMVPWFCRIYIHTLHITTGSLLYQHYIPAKDRQRPHTLEMLLSLPPLSTTTITVQFNRAFLKWTEHPPDAHHGFYINSAVLTSLLSECPNCTITSPHLQQQGEVVLRLHTEPLLISLPTPDFSMPYNVICFVCTVIAIGFGSIFNLTTRTLQPASKQKQGLLAHVIGRLRRKRQD